jgi:transposase
MPVYRLAARDASCASPGCWCRDRARCYPSDLDDGQWAVLEPQARAVMAELTVAAGRPMTHDLRAMCDAVFYVVRNGVEWRALPADFPPWGRCVCLLRQVERPGPAAGPGASAAGEAAGAPGAGRPAHGLDRGLPDRQGRRHRAPGQQRIPRWEEDSRGRHVAVDAEGWLLGLVVTAASVSDRAGAKLLVIRLLDAFGTLKIMWADSGYDGAPLGAWIRAVAGITLEVVRRCDPHAFQVVRRRWVVERTFGWLMRYRRLARDYERLTAHHEAMVYWATIMIMTRRLARYQASQQPEQRWGGNRPQRAAA